MLLKINTWCNFSHAIKQWNEADLDWEKYLDWNEKNQAIETEIAKNKLKFRVKTKTEKKEVSQLFKITFKIAEFLSSLKTEKIKQKWNASLNWSQESEFSVLIQFCPRSESEQDEIFFQWNETESDFIFMRWDRIRNFFVKWDETEDRSSLNEIESSFCETEHLILILQSAYCD